MSSFYQLLAYANDCVPCSTNSRDSVFHFKTARTLRNKASKQIFCRFVLKTDTYWPVVFSQLSPALLESKLSVYLLKCKK